MPTNPPRPVSRAEKAKKTIDPYVPVIALACFGFGGALAQIDAMIGLTLAA